MQELVNAFAIVGILSLLLAARTDHKRINHLERDLTEKRLEGANGSQELQPEPERVNARQLLGGAGVTDEKAIRGSDTAVREGWTVIDIQKNIKLVRFMKTVSGDVVKLNMYYGGKGGGRAHYTVATALTHPTKGKTQLFRKGVTLDDLHRILRNPRAHTDKGYYQNGTPKL